MIAKKEFMSTACLQRVVWWCGPCYHVDSVSARPQSSDTSCCGLTNDSTRNRTRYVEFLPAQQYEWQFGSTQTNADLPMARIFLALWELGQSTPEKFLSTRLGRVEAQAEIHCWAVLTIFETIISLAPLLEFSVRSWGWCLVCPHSILEMWEVMETTEVTAGISEHWLLRHRDWLSRSSPGVLHTFRGLYIRQIADSEWRAARIAIPPSLWTRGPIRLPDRPDPPLQIGIVPLIDAVTLLTFFIMSNFVLTRSKGCQWTYPKAATGQTRRLSQVTVTMVLGRLSLSRKSRLKRLRCCASTNQARSGFCSVKCRSSG